MKPKKDIMPEYPDYYEPEYPGRALEFIKDEDGSGWLCRGRFLRKFPLPRFECFSSACFFQLFAKHANFDAAFRPRF